MSKERSSRRSAHNPFHSDDSAARLSPVKIVLVVLALANLVALFVFNYGLQDPKFENEYEQYIEEGQDLSADAAATEEAAE